MDDAPLAGDNGRGTRPACPPPPDPIAAMCLAHGPVPERGHFAAGMSFGDWRLTAFIGRGGNGEVYCAEHTTLGTPAAVKVLMRDDERAKARFAREARMLAALRSDAFPRFFAYGEANGHPYLAMELLEPGDLPTDERAIARFLLKVCDAVAELHTLGYIHRDIKPGNILWRSVGARVPRARGRAGRASLPSLVPVLADLGLVKDTHPSNPQAFKPSNSPTTLGGVGTPGYGAPEQMERGEATVASDIHALGVLADRCFAGKPPRAWARIIQRATSSIPAHRYQSVAALSRAIRHRNLMRTAIAIFAAAAISFVAVAGMITLRHGIASPQSDAPRTSQPPPEHDYLNEVYKEVSDFYRRALQLKSKIDTYEMTGGNDGIDRKAFKARVEKERVELYRHWEAAKKAEHEKILAFKRYYKKFQEPLNNPAADAVVEESLNAIKVRRDNVDGLLRSTGMHIW